MQLSARNEISDVFGIIKEPMEDVRREITAQFSDCSEQVRKVLDTYDTAAGKMIRPALLVLSGLCFGEITDEHIKAAAVFEMVHNATLLHDDVLDDGKTRRGRPTVNKLWGNESAVLLGDLLLSRVFRMCSKLEPEVRNVIVSTTVRTCEGELRQVLQRDKDLSESEYIEIITEKTAALFGSCCQLGAYLSGANEEHIWALNSFGENLGIGFQISDDLLDIIGDEDRIGKTTGTDIEKSKLTLSLIHLLTSAGAEKKEQILDTLDMSNKESLLEMLKLHGSLDYSSGRVRDFVAAALKALESVQDCKAKKALGRTAGFVEKRAVIS